MRWETKATKAALGHHLCVDFMQEVPARTPEPQDFVTPFLGLGLGSPHHNKVIGPKVFLCVCGWGEGVEPQWGQGRW